MSDFRVVGFAKPNSCAELPYEFGAPNLRVVPQVFRKTHFNNALRGDFWDWVIWTLKQS
ncbi:hypothetical protein [Celeribacter sp. ULVN23_4]